ncbi:UDP-3-O-acyl-N-acetylglucosamine deacetylase [Blochmannia endosymbiont of Polyrhachis (Hedomyrma) turneri]|uniref:UDP-3-O-acyl-N-acetylglucosamine deacetylase n=1 Tax=Blochmannia endosymbiont of Polyrhachis (Hedomyrma) turneri TaxID=1505596 RepID=UPI00061AC080|nr:UDP-3-O-acyl-N-acetylglucosamine deacetylase [Blochmannia endosymbiont of Polyrhachis (Hedomyrma) turneri]
MVRQRTVKRTVKINGIGLHTGRKVTLTLHPALENTGIIYRRVDLNPPTMFQVSSMLVGDTKLCTCLVNEYGVRVSTVEHLSAAQAGLGIDNIVVEINAPEIPIMDGSAVPFVSLLLDAGITELNSAKKFIRVKRMIRVEDGDKWAKLVPYDGFTLDFTIDFNHPAIDPNLQHYFFDFSVESFIYKISPARTFGFIKDVKQLQSSDLVLGGSLDCAIVVDDHQILNKDGLRFKNEFVRHKMLDAIGDLFICGYNLIGSFVGFKSGHALNNKLLKTLLASQESWEFVTFNNESDLPYVFGFPHGVI